MIFKTLKNIMSNPSQIYAKMSYEPKKLCDFAKFFPLILVFVFFGVFVFESPDVDK